jgi:hypothetical protein
MYGFDHDSLINRSTGPRQVSSCICLAAQRSTRATNKNQAPTKILRRAQHRVCKLDSPVSAGIDLINLRKAKPGDAARVTVVERMPPPR